MSRTAGATVRPPASAGLAMALRRARWVRRDHGDRPAEATARGRQGQAGGAWPVIASNGVLVFEILGWLALCIPMPILWFWIGGLVYEASSYSVALDFAVSFFGFVATAVVMARMLRRLDGLWIELRRRTGRDQIEGALSKIVVISAVIGVPAFYFWFNVIAKGFIIPFMPYR